MNAYAEPCFVCSRQHAHLNSDHAYWAFSDAERWFDAQPQAYEPAAAYVRQHRPY